MSSAPVHGDEVRVTSAAHGELTIWWVAIYERQQFLGRIGSAKQKWEAVRIAMDLAEKFDITEVNVKG